MTQIHLDSERKNISDLKRLYVRIYKLLLKHHETGDVCSDAKTMHRLHYLWSNQNHKQRLRHAKPLHFFAKSQKTTGHESRNIRSGFAYPSPAFIRGKSIFSRSPSGHHFKIKYPRVPRKLPLAFTSCRTWANIHIAQLLKPEKSVKQCRNPDVWQRIITAGKSRNLCLPGYLHYAMSLLWITRSNHDIRPNMLLNQRLLNQYEVQCQTFRQEQVLWRSYRSSLQKEFGLYSDFCSENEKGCAMTNQQKIAYVLLLKDFMPPPLFRFLYAYVADLSDVCISEQSEGVEQYMRNPHLYDELIEEEYTKVIAKLGICFDINMFRRELMKKT